MSQGRRDRILALLGLVVAVLVVYFVWARPQQLRWGATREEVQRAMSGDEVDPTPGFLATRAITIDGTPEAIWPWLMQMGYGRAGLYGFDLFQSVGSPTASRSVERILPQFQGFDVGDPVPVSPFTTLTFAVIEPHRHIVWVAEEGDRAVTWGLYPVDAAHTRLVSRTRWSHHWSQPGQLALDLVAEFTDHIAAREVLQGLQGRVEGHVTPRSDMTIKFFLYLGTFLVAIWAAISVLRLPPTLASWLIGFAGGLAWLISWYAPVSIWVGALLAMLVVWAIRVEDRDLRNANSLPRSKPRAPLARKR